MTDLDDFKVVEQRRGLFIVLPPGRIVGALREDDDAWHLYHGPERRQITALRASGRHDAVLEAVELCARRRVHPTVNPEEHSMSDESHQAEIAAIDAMNRAHHAQTARVLGLTIDDGLREAEEREQAEGSDNDNDEEKS